MREHEFFFCPFSGGKLFSKLHRIRNELAREHPDCSTPNQHKFQLKNSYTSPALTQLYHLNGEHHQGTSVFPKRENLKSLETDTLSFWSETEHQLDAYGTHSFCEETGCLQNSRLEKAAFQQKQSSKAYAIRTDPFSCVSPGGQRDCLLSQESFPLPVRPCVIVDTRDPLSVTTDLLGNDVLIERIDSSLDFDKVWTAAPAQEQCLTGTRSNLDILGITSGPQITLSSLFDVTQPTLCSTVNVLPQKVRIVPNTLPLSSQNQKQDEITHNKTSHSESSREYTASLSSGNSPASTEYFSITQSTVESKLLRPFALDFKTTAPQVKNSSKDVQRESIEVGDENWELLSPLCSDKTQDPVFTPHSPQEEQLLEADSWFRARSRSVKQQPGRWGLPEEEVRMWGAQILLALESLHEQGIVCQDLNPRNILLNSSGRCGIIPTSA